MNLIRKDVDIDILEERIIKPSIKVENPKHIVLVHGFATDSRCWDIYVNQSKENYLYLINLPGHGNHDYQPIELSFEYIVSLVKEYVKSVNFKTGEKIVLMGHSYGGAISSVVANELENEGLDIIEKLILLAPYSMFSIVKAIDKIYLFNVKDADSFNKLQEIIFNNAKNSLIALEKFLYKKLSMDFFKKNMKNFKWVIVGMSLPSTFFKINQAFKNIGYKSYFLFGENDKLIDNSRTIKRASSTFNIKPYVSIYENCGHAFFVEESDKFFNEIKDILKK